MREILKPVLWDYIRDTGTIVNNQNIDLVMENAIKSLFGKLVFIEEASKIQGKTHHQLTS